MSRRKLESAALFLALFGAILIVPPFVHVFSGDWTLFGIPGAVVYLFGLWAILIACAGWLSRRLPEEDPEQADRGER